MLGNSIVRRLTRTNRLPNVKGNNNNGPDIYRETSKFRDGMGGKGWWIVGTVVSCIPFIFFHLQAEKLKTHNNK